MEKGVIYLDINNINTDRDTSGLGPIEYDQSKVPALIRKYANNVRTKTYGQEVREAQARNAEVAGLIANDTLIKQNNLESIFTDLTEEMTNKDIVSAPEIISARNGEATLNDRLTKMGNLTSGKNLKIVSGVIRNNGSDNWQIISDENHQGDLGVASVTTGNYGIDINFNFTATKIIGFVATPDETYAKELISVGASVVTDRATINLYQPKPTNQISGRIAYSGGAWTIYNNFGITDVSFGASNDLYINHASCESFVMDITSRKPVLVTFESATATQTKVGFYNPDGTKITTESELMSITFKRDISVVTDTSKPVSAQLNPKLVNNTAGNIWFMGVFEI